MELYTKLFIEVDKLEKQYPNIKNIKFNGIKVELSSYKSY